MTRSRFAIPCAAILAVTALCTVPSSAIADGDPTPADSCASTGGFETGFCTDAHNDSVATAANRRRQHKTPGRQPSGSSSSLDAQRAQQTAEQTTSPEAPQGWSWDLCVLKSIGKEANSRIPSDYDCTPASPDSSGACQFFCVWGLEVGGDSVGVGGGELGEGLFPVGGGASLDEACGGCSFVGGFAGVCEALGGSFVFDVADGEP